MSNGSQKAPQAPQAPQVPVSSVLDPLSKVLQQSTQNQGLALAMGTVVGTVTVRAVDGIVTEVYRWANASPVLAPVANFFQVSILGSTFDLPHVFGIFVYVVLALLVLTFIIFAVLHPLLYDADKEERRQ